MHLVLRSAEATGLVRAGHVLGTAGGAVMRMHYSAARGAWSRGLWTSDADRKTLNAALGAAY